MSAGDPKKNKSFQNEMKFYMEDGYGVYTREIQILIPDNGWVRPLTAGGQ